MLSQLQTRTSDTRSTVSTTATQKNLERLDQFQEWLLKRKDASVDLQDFFDNKNKEFAITVFIDTAQKKTRHPESWITDTSYHRKKKKKRKAGEDTGDSDELGEGEEDNTPSQARLKS